MTASELIICAWALLALGMTLTALLKRQAATVGNSTDLMHGRAVIVLRPLDVPSGRELENLSAPLPNGFRQVVLSPFRPSLAQRPAHTEWLPSDPPSRNRKLGHLHYALAALRYEPAVTTFLVVDADVRIDQALLTSLLAALDAGAACAWASPCPVSPGLTRGLLVQSMHSFEVLAHLSPGPAPLCGKAFAIDARALPHVRALPDCVGEDLELSTRLAAAGLVTTLAGRALLPGPGAHPLPRFTRWMQVLRAHRAGLFPTVPFLFACTPLLLALALTSGPLAQGTVALLVLARSLVAARAEAAGARGLLAAWWWLPAEALLLSAWCAAVVKGSTIEWRGRQLHVQRGGLLVPTGPPAAVLAPESRS